MKKILTVLLCLLIIIPSTLTVKADTVLIIDELGLTINLDDTENTIFTQDVTDDDPNLATYGYTVDQLVSYFKANNIVANIIFSDDISNGNTFEAVYVVKEDTNNLPDFCTFNDTEFDSLAKETYGSVQITNPTFSYTSYTTAKFGKNNFIVLEYSYEIPDGRTVYSRQYYTIYNGYALSISINGYEAEPNDDIINAAEIDFSSFDFEGIDDKLIDSTTPTDGNDNDDVDDNNDDIDDNNNDDINDSNKDNDDSDDNAKTDNNKKVVTDKKTETAFNKTFFIILAIAVAVVIILVIVLFIILNNKKKKKASQQYNQPMQQFGSSPTNYYATPNSTPNNYYTAPSAQPNVAPVNNYAAPNAQPNVAPVNNYAAPNAQPNVAPVNNYAAPNTCPSCGAPIDESTKFCGSCGYKL